MTTTVPCFQFDTVEVRPATFEVLRDGTPLALEPKSIRVLIHLLENRDRAVSKDEILQAVWGGTAVTDNSLTRVIAQLRRELGDDARAPRYIQTVPTLGYRFVGDVIVHDSAPQVSQTAPAPSQLPTRSTALPLFGIAFVVLLCGAVWLTAMRRPADVTAPRLAPPVQLTTSPGLDLAPSLSPDGRRFAYSSDKSGSFQIYVRSVDTASGEVQLTNDSGQNIQPVWSPDGSRIAWHSVTRKGIWVAPADGSAAPHQIIRWGSQPAWSPDGTRIAYRSDDVTSLSVHDLISAVKTSILVSNADGSGSATTVATTGSVPGRQAFPAWTPDSKRILFSAIRGAAGELWLVGADGKYPRLLLQREKNVFISPVFSPGGDSVYFGALAERTRDLGIWQQRLTPEGGPLGEPVELARMGSVAPLYLSLSRDGKRLTYTALTSTSNLWSIPLAGTAASGPPRPLYQDNVYRASFPSFSPDGKRIAFFSRLFGGAGDIWTVNADGTNAGQVTSSDKPDVMPQWSPDGNAIRYGRLSGHSVQLWERSIADGSERPVTSESKNLPGWPRLSPDGRRVVYHSMHFASPSEAAMNISVADLPDLGNTRQLTRDGEGAGFPAWSPDGGWIAYELIRGPHTYIAVMDANGRMQEQLNSDPGHSWLFGWSPDGSKILFAGFREGTWNLWWIDRRTREQKRLTDYRSLRTFVRYPACSPTGDQIVYELGTTRGNIFRLDLN